MMRIFNNSNTEEKGLPLVSIILPTYNREKVIGRAIESILQQTFSDFELIVVDDCSQDDSCKIVESYNDPRIKLIKNQQNYGANYSRNVGIKESKGEYIAFQDSDDEWVLNKLEVQLSYMMERKLMASFSPYLVLDDSRIVPEDFQIYANDYDLVREKLKQYNIVGTPTLIIKRNIVNEVGLFDENIPRLQDYEYVIRIIKKYNIGCCPVILLKVHADDVRITSDKEKLDIALGIIIQKHIDFICLHKFFAIRHILLDEVGIFNKKIFEELKENSIYNSFAIDYLKQEVKLQEKKKDYIFQINIRRLENQNFAIYGAGHLAKKTYYELKKYNKAPRCFIVTDSQSYCSIDGIEVVGISDIVKKDLTIVVAVANKTQSEILEFLVNEGFSDVFTI